jgi:DNA helicase HerA-like ATPase
MPTIGRIEGGGPTCRLGRYRASDGSLGAELDLDVDRPHVVLVVGKRGTGKSYTLGVVAEALAETRGIAPVVADPMGAFRTLEDGAIPAGVVDPTVSAGAVDPESWCSLLGLDPEAGPGTLLWQAAEESETLAGMETAVEAANVPEETRRAVRNHLKLARSWGVFGRDGPNLTGGEVSVVDLSTVPRRPTNAVVAGVADRLYRGRSSGRIERLPWLVVDEAHVAFDGIAREALRRVATRGRQPGVSLMAATQRPSALPEVAVSQADLLVVHRLTCRADREALARARPSYVAGSFEQRMPTEPGEALVVDDATESVHEIRVRERRTPHGGESPRVAEAFESAE